MLSVASVFLAVLVELSGVTGNALRARAFFDANNVRVGDPLVLTVDFLGDAEFHDLHPPELSRFVDRRDWKLDDASAKTETVEGARRITYRVRPMRPGVLWFPGLEFAYEGPGGAKRTVRANEIPVHARAGRQVVVAEMREDVNAMPEPPALATELGSATRKAVSEDVLFAWRKACAKPTAAAFAQFDFPEGRMNEATCRLREGNWAAALKIYRLLEWRVGQTPELERGIVAALALKYDNPQVELPVWRQVLRPLLRQAWAGRIGWVLGGFLAVTLLFMLLGRLVRVLACLALLLLPSVVSADTVERTVTTNANGSVTVREVRRSASGNAVSTSVRTTFGGGAMPGRGIQMMMNEDPFDMMPSIGPFGRRRNAQKPRAVSIDVRLESDKPSVTVGEDFKLVMYLERPRYVGFSGTPNLQLDPAFPAEQVEPAYALADTASRNPTNVIQRVVFPLRVTAPFAGPLRWNAEGAYVFANSGWPGFFERQYPFSSGPKALSFAVKAPPEAGRPADYSGIVAEQLTLDEICDLRQVRTNDVVTISYRVGTRGCVPKDFFLPGAAFEQVRDKTRGLYAFQRYVVADGTPTTPRVGLSYYNPRTKRYVSVAAGGTRLQYRPEEDGE